MIQSFKSVRTLFVELVLQEREKGKHYLPNNSSITSSMNSSADQEQQGWQPYLVDPYSALRDDHTYTHTYILSGVLFLICLLPAI